MGAVLRSLLACSFCVLLRGGRESGGTGKLVGFAGGKEGVSFCCVYGGGGEGGRRSWERSRERPGRGEGGSKGPGRRGCALRPATLQPPPRLPHRVRTERSSGLPGGVTSLRSPILSE